MLNLPFSGSLGVLPKMSGPEAEKVVREYLALFQKLSDKPGSPRIIYLPEKTGPLEGWIDLELHEPGDYVPMTVAEAKRFTDAVDSLILIMQPTTGIGLRTMEKEGSYPSLGGLKNDWELLTQTHGLLSDWKKYKHRVAKKTPWGWIIAITLGAGVTVTGAYWYQKRYAPARKRRRRR